MSLRGRWARGLIGAGTALAACAVLTGTAHAAAYQEVRNYNSSKCLDVMSEDGYYSDGARVQQYHCTGVAEQHWNVKPVNQDGNGETVYVLISRRSGKCMTVFRDARFAGAQVVQGACRGHIDLGGAAGELWYKRTNSHGPTLVNYGSGLCLDISGASKNDHAKVQVYWCNDSSAQAFTA
ncbi:RICIN domain-containing protein [Actinomadura parmotrematis]|uniref:RICIN domain-containing protein n=1 Tax=Actinomadura parmotrematis TaxID=2864039 RepID=A0ABS7FK50_9ACTN|nr:RICIN domain-containing protein [Actinomadura parmotrematis]MBW8480736.1 RICIN domain-containing protein [Actinomadura parmotrematis]